MKGAFGGVLFFLFVLLFLAKPTQQQQTLYYTSLYYTSSDACEGKPNVYVVYIFIFSYFLPFFLFLFYFATQTTRNALLYFARRRNSSVTFFPFLCFFFLFL